jgi:hypothetical protein
MDTNEQSKFTPQELDAIYDGVSKMHTALTGFDDHGNPVDTQQPELGVTKSVEEMLSPVAKVRLELAELFAAHKQWTGEFKGYKWQEAMKKRYMTAREVFYDDIDMKVKMLLDTIDSQQQELEALRGQVEVANKAAARFYGYYEAVLGVIENGEPGHRYQEIEKLTDEL